MVETTFGLFTGKKALGFLIRLTRFVCLWDSLVSKLCVFVAFLNVAIWSEVGYGWP